MGYLKAIKFKDQNSEIAKDQKEYNTLPALRLNDKEGSMVTCYKASFVDRIIILLTGKIWMSEMTFNKPITPRILATKSKNVYVINK